jgi:F-type H+-transporting ATPase subunit epsilon
LATLNFELISPQQILFDGAVNSVMLHGAEGDMTVLPGHARLVTLVNPGMIEAVDADGNNLRIFVSRAFAEITGDSVVVLAELAVMEEELNQEHIDQEIVYLESQFEAAADETTRANIRTQIWQLDQINVKFRD